MSAATDLHAGSELLGFRVERVLGRGGMGVVYLAQQLALDRMVALKLLAPELAGDSAFRERFLRESRLAAALDHPNIVPVFDAGEADGRLYIAMRYVEGTDLRRLLDEEGPLSPERTLALLAPVADALDTAHAKGLVHRDVKPSNILVDQQGRPYLADFGLSKSTAAGGMVEQSHFAASLDYVAPEQIEQRPVGPAADVYALACVLCECLTGEPPFKRDTPLATLWAHTSDPPPQTGGPIDPVLLRALAKDPDQRYPSCRELIAAARDALGLRSIPARISRRAVVLAGAAALMAGALAASLALTVGDGTGTPKPSLAVTNTSLVRIDPETNRIAAVIDVGSGPKAVAVGERTVWVYNLRDGIISAIDPETNKILRTTRVSGTPREAADFNGPVLAADEDFAWAGGTDAGGKGVLERVSASDIYKPEYPLPYKSSAVAVGDGAVWVLATGGFASGDEDVLLRIDPTTGAVLKRVTLFGEGLAVGEGAVWATVYQSAEMHRIDPATSAVTGTVDLSKGPSAEPAAGLGFVWVTTTDGLLRVDPRTLRVTKTIPVPGTGSGMGAYGFDVALTDGSVWVYAGGPGTVLRIAPRTGKTISTIRLHPQSAEYYPSRIPSSSIAAGAGGVWVAISG